MASKYYLAHNAGGRKIGGQQFEIIDIFNGTAIGIFEATTEAQQKDLDALAKDPASAVTELTKDEYLAESKKKTSNLNNFPHSNAKPLQTSLSEVVGVVVEGNPQEDLTEGPKLDTVEGALSNLGKIEPPPKVEEPSPKSKKK